MTEIAKDATDLDVLFARLRGTHRSTRGTFIGAYVLAAFFIGVAVYTGFKTASPMHLDELALDLALPLVLTAFGVGFVLQSHTTYTFSENTITKSSPIPLLSWTLHRSEVHVVGVDFVNYGKILMIRTIDEKRRAIPLDGTLQDALATLYPEFERYVPTARDHRRWKWLAVILTVVTLGTVGMIWWLAKQGLVVW